MSLFLVSKTFKTSDIRSPNSPHLSCSQNIFEWNLLFFNDTGNNKVKKKQRIKMDNNLQFRNMYRENLANVVKLMSCIPNYVLIIAGNIDVKGKLNIEIKIINLLNV